MSLYDGEVGVEEEKSNLKIKYCLICGKRLFKYAICFSSSNNSCQKEKGKFPLCFF